MDVKCATCKEPWDTYHLRHDAVHDTEAGLAIINDSLDHEEYLKKFTPGSRKYAPFQPSYKGEVWAGKLTPFWTEQFKKAGFVFGGSLMAVLQCPCCPKDKEQTPEAKYSIYNYQLLADLLDGDDDGMATFLEDYGDSL